MRKAIQWSFNGMRRGQGGPFGAVIVRQGKLLSGACNRVIALNDPTAHAEIQAIRLACRRLGRFELGDCELYTSCEPCPMCLAAIYWARLPIVYYANTKEDAAAIGFDDADFYQEMARPPARRRLVIQQGLRDAAQVAFREWRLKPDKVRY